MNRERAKEILAGYRPDVDLATEPEIAEALALLEHEPELARWFEREQAADAAVRRTFQEIPVPVGLETRLLANRPKPRARMTWWREPSLIAAAAAVLVVAGTSAVWLAPWRPVTWSDYQAKMVEEVSEPYPLHVETRDPERVREAMASAGFPADYRVPPGLRHYPLEGGYRLRWRGHKVAVVCFGAESENRPDIWLIVVNRMALSGAPTSDTPQFDAIGASRIARWADAENLYLVTTRDGPELRELF